MISLLRLLVATPVIVAGEVAADVTELLDHIAARIAGV